MDKIEKHISNTYPNRDWHQGCNHIEWENWHVMVDNDDSKIRIGGYKLDENNEYDEEATIWIEIPESEEDIAIATLDGLTTALANL